MVHISLNGVYGEHGAYLNHAVLSSIRTELNGNAFTDIKVKFPDEVENIFHHTLSSLKKGKNELTLQSRKEGRTIFTWKMNTSECTDVLSVERTGNMRLNFQRMNV